MDTHKPLCEDQLIRDISPNDEMYASDKDYGDRYWRTGRSALECILHSMAAAGKQASDAKRILDFPCGHGRVLRYLKLAFPYAEITACDLLTDGVDFCASTFGAIPIYSHNDPSRIDLPRRTFDLIWVGSLFTHFNADRWSSFLNLFVSSLNEDGLLIFTAHGFTVHQWLKGPKGWYGLPYFLETLMCRSYERNGFGYSNYNSSDEYGFSLSTPAWVCDQIRQIPELEMVHFSARAWAHFHDTYSCRRVPDRQILPATSGSTYWKHKARAMAPYHLVRFAKRLGFKGPTVVV